MGNFCFILHCRHDIDTRRQLKNTHILTISNAQFLRFHSFSFYLEHTCTHVTDCPPPWRNNSCLPVFHPWKPGAIKVGVFTEMLFKSPNRFLFNFTIDLWIERRMSAAHFLALLWGWLPFTIVFKDYPRLHAFFSALFGLEALPMFPFTQPV